ncbi:50S ribosomal protein L2 [Candidatus Azambacteria bacterium]|nr:50S ribosomal protein L2 [Candidatus Azambacteria bacterium]MBI2587758.1 50S ribosomal protein L2 [Candidatus Azambacteria bacterium]
MVKLRKPITPGQRQLQVVDFSLLTKKKPEKRLLGVIAKRAGRGAKGRITVWHKGGGEKRRYRVIDFKEEKLDIPAKVRALEYDPNRTAFIALLFYADGDKRYILAPQGLKAGDSVLTAEKAPLEPGNRMKLKNIPVGTFVHNVELLPGKGGQIIRSAGAGAQVLAHEGEYAHLKLPSGEVRRVPEESFASIGMLSNPEWGAISIGKAGRARHLGIRPTVRGSAMNPVDHPHGGGEGRAPIGLKHPKTPWGKPALGVKTRKKRKPSDRFIIQRRPKK